MVDVHDTFLILADTLQRAGVKDQAVITLEPSDYLALLHLALREARPGHEISDNSNNNVSGFRSHFDIGEIKVRSTKPIHASKEGIDV